MIHVALPYANVIHDVHVHFITRYERFKIKHVT